MSRTDVARRYASAMFSLASEQRALPQVREGAERLVAALGATPEATEMLANRTIAASTRRALLDKILAAVNVHVTIANLARLLLDRGRIDALPAIVAELVRLIDAESGQVTAEVVSAMPLNEAELGRIRTALGKRLGRVVELTSRVDASLIGGIRIEVGHLVFDGSVRNHLDRLREQLESHHVA